MNWTKWISLGLIAACLIGFAGLAAEIREHGTPRIDKRIVRLLRPPGDQNDPVGSKFVEQLIREVDALGGYFPLTYFALPAFIYLLMRHRFRAATLFAVTVGGAGGISLLLKFIFNRSRPAIVEQGSQFTSSFPSGHALMSLVIYLTLGGLIAGVQPTRGLKVFILSLAGVLAFLAGSSRVYLGRHWPSDVLAGFLVGLAWTLGCWLTALWLQKRGKIEREVPIPGKW